MPCTVKKAFEIARATGNHLLVQLKANHAKLFDAVSAIADRAATTDTAFTCNIRRSRQEDRIVEVLPAGDVLAATEWHSVVKAIIRVTRHTMLRFAATGLWEQRVTSHTWLRSAATGLWEQRGEVAYYLSSATGITAIQLGDAIRGH